MRPSRGITIFGAICAFFVLSNLVSLEPDSTGPTALALMGALPGCALVGWLRGRRGVVTWQALFVGSYIGASLIMPLVLMLLAGLEAVSPKEAGEAMARATVHGLLPALALAIAAGHLFARPAQEREQAVRTQGIDANR